MATIFDVLRAPKSQRYIAIEAYWWLWLAMLLVRFVPFRWWSRWLGQLGHATSDGDLAAPDYTVRRVKWAIAAAGAQVPWHSTCLMNAFAGKMLLRRRRVASTVYLGARRSQDALNTRLAAHAWLRVGSQIILGADEAAYYQPVAWFGDRA